MQRYFINEQQLKSESNEIRIVGNDVHHIRNVMRMKTGNRVIAIIENQYSFLAEIKTINDKEVVLLIVEQLEEQNELLATVVIAQGVVRKDKAEEVIRRVTELGASAYISVIMERSILKVKDTSANYFSRWRLIAKEASEQSHRSKILNVLETLNFEEFIKFSTDFDFRYYAYEEAAKSKSNAFDFSIENYQNKKVLILVGPEGGFSMNEVNKLNKANFIPISLGPRILRTETAPLYIMSVLSNSMERK